MRNNGKDFYMKWYDIKKYSPTYDGFYFVRYVTNTNYTKIDYVQFDGQYWMDYDEHDHLFKKNITHFAVPEPVEID